MGLNKADVCLVFFTVPVMIGDDCRERAYTHAIAHHVNLLTEVGS